MFSTLIVILFSTVIAVTNSQTIIDPYDNTEVEVNPYQNTTDKFVFITEAGRMCDLYFWCFEKCKAVLKPPMKLACVYEYCICTKLPPAEPAVIGALNTSN